MINLSSVEQIIQAHPQWLLSNILRDDKSNVVALEFICDEEPYYGERLVIESGVQYDVIHANILVQRRNQQRNHDFIPS